MEILISTLEAEGFMKIGGIGDYISGISKVLANEDNFNVKVIMPKYREIKNENLEFLTSISIDDSSSFSDELVNFNLYTAKLNNVDFYFVENEYYFEGRDVYIGKDVYLRFAFFSRAIAETMKNLDWNIDILHFNDKPDGLLPLICKNTLSNIPKFVYTIHSVYYSGYFKIDENCSDLFNFYLGCEWGNTVCFMKEGIIHSDVIMTVGKTNAEEIQTPEKGYHLDKYIRDNGGVVGCLNGINYDLYPRDEDFSKFLDNKRKAKSDIQKRFNLEVDANIPLFMFCGRLSGSGKQKGGLLLLGIMDYLMKANCQFILLADCDDLLEEFMGYSKIYPNFIPRIEHNEKLAQQLYEASDILLMPSLCEPNGLSQIIAMHYGTVPIVHNVGGLKDTVVDVLKYDEDGNGFKFYNPNVEEFKNVIGESIKLFNNKKKWVHIIENSYNEDYSWEKMIKPYVETYNKLCEE